MSTLSKTALGNILILVLLIISGMVWFRVYKTYSKPEENGLLVTFLDVGQGDSILITTPAKKHILIDGGTIPKEWSTFDAGKYVVVPYLRSMGIRKLDLVVATHPDMDHIGGLIAVLKQSQADTFLDSGTVATTQTYEDLLKLIEKKDIKYEIAGQGEYKIDPSIKLEILSPISEGFANDPNNNSIVIRLEYGKISFLFTGDIGELAETLYVEKYGDRLKSTILKVGHHGGEGSSSIPFLNCVLPSVAVISCGRNNPFGHPKEEVVNRISSIGTTIYRTDKNGTITINTDGEKWRVHD